MPAKPILENNKIKVFELLGSGDEKRIEEFLSLYAKFFPKYAHYISRMRRRAKSPSESRKGHYVHYWLIEYQDTPAGLFMFRYILPRKCGIGTALALDPSTRGVILEGKSLTEFLFDRVREHLEADAVATGNPEYFGFASEIEHSRLMERFEKIGMVELPLKYFEPVFPSDAKELSREEILEETSFIPVCFGIMPNPKSKFMGYSPQRLKDFALAFLVDHYNLDENHEKVQEVIRSIPTF